MENFLKAVTSWCILQISYWRAHMKVCLVTPRDSAITCQWTSRHPKVGRPFTLRHPMNHNDFRLPTHVSSVNRRLSRLMEERILPLKGSFAMSNIEFRDFVVYEFAKIYETTAHSFLSVSTSICMLHRVSLTTSVFIEIQDLYLCSSIISCILY